MKLAFICAAVIATTGVAVAQDTGAKIPLEDGRYTRTAQGCAPGTQEGRIQISDGGTVFSDLDYTCKVKSFIDNKLVGQNCHQGADSKDVGEITHDLEISGDTMNVDGETFRLCAK